MQNTTTKSTSTSSLRNRFNHLRTMFHQALLCESEFNELVQLAVHFNKKMAGYLKANRSMFI